MSQRRSKIKHKDQKAITSPPPQVFQFINLNNDTLRLEDDDRSIIREVVMNNFHQRKRQKNEFATKGIPPKGSLTFLTSIKQHTQVFALQPRIPKGSALNAPETLPTTNELEDTAQEVASLELDSYLDNQVLLDAQLEVLSFHPEPSLAEKRRARENAAEVQRIINSLELCHQSLDPLISFPVNSNPRSAFLVNHFFQTRSLTSMIMMGVRKSWFQASLQDPAYFNVALSIFATCVTIRTKLGDPIESLAFRIEAARIVNERIKKGVDHISDGSIGAVAYLLVYEANNGDLKAMQTHLCGLYELINLRGGFMNANFPPAIQRNIAWAELNVTNILQTPPVIIPYTSPQLDLAPYTSSIQPRGPFAPLVEPSPGDGSYTIDFSFIHTDLTSIFNGLRYLTSILDSKSPAALRAADSMWFSDKTYLVQRAIQVVSQGLDPNSEHSKMDVACCIAGSVFCHVYLRDLAFFSQVSQVMVSRLKQWLETLVREVLEDSPGDEMLKLFWCLIMGGIPALDVEERRWFVEWIGIVAGELGVRSREDAYRVVKRILWSMEWDGHLDDLWVEVERHPSV